MLYYGEMRRHVRRTKPKKLFYYSALAAGVAFFSASCVFIIWLFTIDIPDLSSFNERKIVESTKIYDSTGKILLYDARGDIIRTVIPFEEIPRQVKNATVAIEDSNFYNHSGLSLESIARAFFVNLFSGDIRQGGSTITQQLVKKALLSDERTFTRKIKEAILALRVERVFSKEEILNLYLNEIPYGAQSYGIQAASETFFGKPAKDLTLTEAAYLAALPKAPTYYSPYGQHRDELDERKNLVLRRMNELGFATSEEVKAAMEGEAGFVSRADQGIKAPHFIMYVLDELIKKYGEDTVESGGLKVITSLNWELQARAEELTKKFVEEEEEQFNVSNAGLLAMDPKTGHILAMVGSRDYFDVEREGNFNVTTALRQPGSSIKPIVYATALKKGYTDKTVVFDLPTEFNSSCDPNVPEKSVEESPEEKPEDKCYHPVNYDGVFRGPVTIREALAQSINVPSVKVLYLAGLPEALAAAKTLGITTFTDPSRYGLSLVLGGGEVKLLEMVGAYSVFANEGKKNPPTAILKIENSRRDILYEYQAPNEAVLQEDVTRTISSMLSDNRARTPAFGANSFLYFPGRDVAVKTGTTNDYRDAWVIGYTPNIAAGVWFGNNDNSPMEKKVAGFIAAPLWNAFMTEALGNLPSEEFSEPKVKEISKPALKGEWRGSQTYKIDKISKKLATEFTPPEFTEERVLTQVHSILRWIDKNDPSGPIPQNPEKDPQYHLWEYPVRIWAAQQGFGIDQTEEDIPKETDDIHREEYRPNIYFIVPPPDQIASDQVLLFSVYAEGRFAIKQMDVFADNRLLGTIRDAPYRFSVDLSKTNPSDTLRLSVKVYDIVGNSAVLTKNIGVCFQEKENCL